MKEIEKKDTREISGGVTPSDDGGGCTGPFWPKDYPDSPTFPYIEPDQPLTDPAE